MYNRINITNMSYFRYIFNTQIFRIVQHNIHPLGVFSLQIYIKKKLKDGRIQLKYKYDKR